VVLDVVKGEDCGKVSRTIRPLSWRRPQRRPRSLVDRQCDLGPEWRHHWHCRWVSTGSNRRDAGPAVTVAQAHVRSVDARRPLVPKWCRHVSQEVALVRIVSLPRPRGALRSPLDVPRSCSLGDRQARPPQRRHLWTLCVPPL